MYREVPRDVIIVQKLICDDTFCSINLDQLFRFHGTVNALQAVIALQA